MKTEGKKKQEEEIIVSRSEGRISLKYFKGKNLRKCTYGEIFQVKQKSSKELFLCKQISKSKIADMERFNIEIAAALKMDNPSLAKLYDVYEDTRHIYLISEQCLGQSVFDGIIKKIGNGEIYSEKYVSGLFKQMISAIAHSHSLNVAHKDIRPDNFLYQTTLDDSPLKLIDTGCSKIFGELKGVGKRLGPDSDKGKNNYNPAAKTYNIHFVPPELLQGAYDEKSDVWSLGVMLYMMITGVSPIKGETTAEMYKMISRMKVSYHDPIWKTVSDELKDLLKHMLCDIANRYTAQQVLDHEWVKNNAANGSAEAIQNFDIESFKKLSSNYLLKKNMVSILSTKLKEEEIIAIKSLFDSVKGEDGMIEIAKLKESFMQMELSEVSAETLFKYMDQDGNGKIDFNEFITAAVEQFSYFREEELLDTFKVIDLDGSGKLSKQEIKSVMKKDKVSDETVEKLVKEFDLNSDGEIDYNEFLHMMEKISIIPIKVDDAQQSK